MQKFWAVPFKYGLTFGIIQYVSITFFFSVTLSVLFSCVFYLHPLLIPDESDRLKNNIYIVFVAINILGDYFLAMFNDGKYKTGLLVFKI